MCRHTVPLCAGRCSHCRPGARESCLLSCHGEAVGRKLSLCHSLLHTLAKTCQLPGLNAISGSFTSKMMLCVTSLAPCMVRSRKQRTSTDWKLPLLLSAPDLCLFHMIKKGEEKEQALSAFQMAAENSRHAITPV